jgi:hypothetical protein
MTKLSNNNFVAPMRVNFLFTLDVPQLETYTETFEQDHSLALREKVRVFTSRFIPSIVDATVILESSLWIVRLINSSLIGTL